jgi:hypothetical protein
MPTKKKDALFRLSWRSANGRINVDLVVPTWLLFGSLSIFPVSTKLLPWLLDRASHMSWLN